MDRLGVIRTGEPLQDICPPVMPKKCSALAIAKETSARKRWSPTLKVAAGKGGYMLVVT